VHCTEPLFLKSRVGWRKKAQSIAEREDAVATEWITRRRERTSCVGCCESEGDDDTKRETTNALPLQKRVEVIMEVIQGLRNSITDKDPPGVDLMNLREGIVNQLNGGGVKLQRDLICSDDALVTRIFRMYSFYDREKLSEVPALIERFKEVKKTSQGQEGQRSEQNLLDMLVKKYGPEPAEERSEWACQKCTFLNAVGDYTCAMCGEPNFHREISI